jgi:hypothetical protein
MLLMLHFDRLQMKMLLDILRFHWDMIQMMIRLGRFQI